MKRCRVLMVLALALGLGLASAAARADNCVLPRSAALRKACLDDNLRPLFEALAPLERRVQAPDATAWRAERDALGPESEALYTLHRSRLQRLAHERLRREPGWRGGSFGGRLGGIDLELLWLPTDDGFPASFALQWQQGDGARRTQFAGFATADRGWTWRDCEIWFNRQDDDTLVLNAQGACHTRGTRGRIRGDLPLPEQVRLQRLRPVDLAASR